MKTYGENSNGGSNREKSKLMKNQMKVLAIGFALMLTSGWALAATTNVFSVDNLQQAINNAAPGDTLILGPGDYAGNVVIPIPITMITSSNALVNLKGTVQISGNGSSTFQSINFLNNVTIQVTNLPSSATVSVINCGFSAPMTSSGATVLAQSSLFQNPVTIYFTNSTQ